ncbi:hypothetical protein QZH41_003006, partial [Actinostola sp. cb2023]
MILTEGPHLYYVDTAAMVLKGQIPWTKELRAEAKSFKVFFVHTDLVDEMAVQEKVVNKVPPALVVEESSTYDMVEPLV